MMTPSSLMSPRVTFWRTPSPTHVGDVLSEWPLMVYKLFFTAIKISERHDILYETIGYLPEEQTSYEQVWIIANSSLVFVIFGTILEAILVIIYNEKVHPFKNIIIDFITAEKQGVDNVMMNDLKSSSPKNIRNKQNNVCTLNNPHESDNTRCE